MASCLFCQNASHKLLEWAPQTSAEKMVAAALDPRVRCVCFFGGSPEPQLSFAVEVSERIAEGTSRGMLRRSGKTPVEGQYRQQAPAGDALADRCWVFHSREASFNRPLR
jgi:pyruvate-formate lyase-activating enzyme